MILVHQERVVEIMDSYEQVANGIKVKNCVYPDCQVIDVIPPDYVIPDKYGYSATKSFYIREQWKNKKEQIESDAKDTLMLELIEGGLI